MAISAAKVVLALKTTWDVLSKHGDISNTYMRVKKEAHMDIYLQVPSCMTVSENTLRKIGATHLAEVVLELRRSLYVLNQAERLWGQ